MDNERKIEYFLRDTGMLPELDAAALADGFIGEMRAGLSGDASSIRMLPTFLRPDCAACDGGAAAVIDAGGTNFRSAVVSFEGAAPHITRLRQDVMPGSASGADWHDFTAFAADRLTSLTDGVDRAGICFSYPAEITPERDGIVLTMTKHVRLNGSEGRRVCADIAAELRAGRQSPPRMALLNDTVAAALGAGAVETEPTDGYIGLIWGTGLNTCCELDADAIAKLNGAFSGKMLINLESGGYSGLPLGEADRLLDAASNNAGLQLNEKTCGGAYFGELSRYTLLLAARRGLIPADAARRLETPGCLSTAECFNLARQGGCAGEIIGALARRSALFVSASLMAILQLTGQGRDAKRPVGLAVEGGTFHGSGLLRPLLEAELERSVGADMRRRFRLVTTPDVNLVGAAAAALQS